MTRTHATRALKCGVGQGGVRDLINIFVDELKVCVVFQKNTARAPQHRTPRGGWAADERGGAGTHAGRVRRRALDFTFDFTTARHALHRDIHTLVIASLFLFPHAGSYV